MTKDLVTELAAAHRGMPPDHRDHLIGLGADPGVVVSLLGVLPAQIEDRFWQPIDGADLAIILPVFVDDIMSPVTLYPALASQYGDLIDLIAFDITKPDDWALRIGAAAWLGAYEPQLMTREPVTVWRTPWEWVCTGGVGIVPLVDDAVELRRLLLPCHSLAVADVAQGRVIKRALERPFPTPRILVRHHRVKEAAE